VGAPSAKDKARYQSELAIFCDWILKLDARIDFRVSSRGFGYIMENEGLIDKTEFDIGETIINDARKSGDLPVDICATDQRRVADNVETIHGDVQTHAAGLISGLRNAHLSYFPFSFWEDQEYYVEQSVEKIDLKSLNGPICAEYFIPITNGAAWNDINSRFQMMERFKYWESRGKKCVLLYCGDFDPAGLQISSFLRSNMQDLAEAVGWDPRNLIIDRFGLNYDFIIDQGLTWIPNLKTSGKYSLDDPRHREHKQAYVQNYLRSYGVRKVEANALVTRPEAGRELCRAAINRYVPETAPEEYRRAIAPHREQLRQTVEAMLGGAA
jgi:hypothetical protein